MSKNNLNYILELMGLDAFDSIGSGNFSRNFMTNRKTVLKVTVDKSYMRFVRAAQSLDNIYLPKIITDFGCIANLYVSENISYKVYAVELPFYDGINRNLPSNARWDRYEVESILESIESSVKHGCNVLLNQFTVDRLYHLMEKYEIEDEIKFIEALSFIAYRKVEEGSEIFFDVHSDNVMWNSETNQMVFIDPIAENDSVNAIGGSYTNGCDINKMVDMTQLKTIEKIQNLLGDGLNKENCMLNKLRFNLGYRFGDENEEKPKFKVEVKFSEKFDSVVTQKKDELEALHNFSRNEALAIMCPMHWKVYGKIADEVKKKHLAVRGLVKGFSPQREIMRKGLESKEALKSVKNCIEGQIKIDWSGIREKSFGDLSELADLGNGMDVAMLARHAGMQVKTFEPKFKDDLWCTKPKETTLIKHLNILNDQDFRVWALPRVDGYGIGRAMMVQKNRRNFREESRFKVKPFKFLPKQVNVTVGKADFF